MAGATQHTASSKGPLPGVYMEFDLPIKEDKKDDDQSTIETLYCKECIGKFLGLKAAKGKVGTFSKGKNSGKTFAIRSAKGQRTFTLLLKKGTKIEAQGFNDKSKFSKEVKTITVSFPNTVTVSELREYLITKSPVKDKILGFVTPQGRKYTWQGPLGDKETAVEKSTIN